MGLELPFTIVLAVALRGERIGLAEMLGIGAVFCGVMLAATAKPLGAKLRKGGSLERGVFFGLLGAVGIGASNFVTGVASQDISPILAVWFSRALFSTLFCGYLLSRGRLGATLKAAHAHVGLVSAVSVLYLVAFTAYAVAMTRSSISIVTTISGGYIVLAVMLGVVINKERLGSHQKLGVAAALVGILALALLSA
jgi:drug/metabolite transporter (DMT)-like permease